MADRIDQAWMVVAEDETGEGLAVWCPVPWKWMPLVAADEARLADIRHMAQIVANQSGKPVKLIRLSVREDLETINPV